MVDFDEYKDVRNIASWIGIIGGTIATAKFLEIDNSIIVFIVIAVILVLLIRKKDTKIEYLENKLKRLEMSSNGKENGKKT